MTYRVRDIAAIGFKNNGMVEFFFTCVEGHEDQVQYILMNIIAKPDKYKVGEIYWWPEAEPAFPH